MIKSTDYGFHDQNMIKGITAIEKRMGKLIFSQKNKGLRINKFSLNFDKKRNEVLLKALRNSNVYFLAWEGTQKWLLRETISVNFEISIW